MTATYAGKEPLPPNMPRMLVKTADWDSKQLSDTILTPSGNTFPLCSLLNKGSIRLQILIRLWPPCSPLLPVFV